MKKLSYLIAAVTAAGLLGVVGGADAMSVHKSFKSVVSGHIATATKTAKAALDPIVAAAAKNKLTIDKAAQKTLAIDAKSLVSLKMAAGKSKQVSSAYNYALNANGVASLNGNTVTIMAGGTTPTSYNFVIPQGDLSTVQGGTSLTALNKLKAYWSNTVKADKAAYAAATKPDDATVASAFASLLKANSANCLGVGATSYAPGTSTPSGSCTF